METTPAKVDKFASQNSLKINLFENSGQASDRKEQELDDLETSRFSQKVEIDEIPKKRCLATDPGIEFFSKFLQSFEFLNSIDSDEEDNDEA